MDLQPTTNLLNLMQKRTLIHKEPISHLYSHSLIFTLLLPFDPFNNIPSIKISNT